MRRPTKGGNRHGMNWIRKSKRLAIYLRDGLACCWCGRTIEDSIILTLDHAIPRSRGGSNEPRNLFTACIGCNGRRKHFSLAMFARTLSIAAEGVIPATEYVAHIRHQLRQPIDVREAERIIARRGGLADALRDYAKTA